MKSIWATFLLGVAVGIGGTLWWKEQEPNKEQASASHEEQQPKGGGGPNPGHVVQAPSLEDEKKRASAQFDAPKPPESPSSRSTLEKLSLEELEWLVWEIKATSTVRDSPSPENNVAGMPITKGQWPEDISEENKRKVLVASLKSELAHAKSIQPKANPAGTPQIPKLNAPPGMQVTEFSGKETPFEFKALHVWIHDQNGWVPKRKGIKALKKRGDLRSALLLKLVAENPTAHPMRRVRAIRALVAVAGDEYDAPAFVGRVRMYKEPLPSELVKTFVRQSLEELSHNPKTPKRIAAVAQEELDKLLLKRKGP